jgi:hypothetical protein
MLERKKRDITEEGPWYRVDGVLVPRVTTVLSVVPKPYLATWRGNIGNRLADKRSEEAMSYGSMVHLYADQVNRQWHRDKRDWRVPRQLEKTVFAYRDWFDAHVDTVLISEGPVISDAHQYAGTSDLVAMLRGDTVPSLIDLKTSKNPATEWPLQLAAYTMALKEEGIEIGRRIILQLPKVDSKASIAQCYEFNDIEDDTEAWLNALRFWKWINRQDGRAKRAPGAFVARSPHS